MFLAGYRPLCLSIRFCFAMTPNNRITNRQDFDTVAACILDLGLILTNMGVLEYQNLPADVRREYANENLVRMFFSESVACYHQSGVENFRIGADIGIAMLKWLIDKLF